MTPKRPDVIVLGDNDRRTMWRRGYIHGFNATHVVWVFGFLPGTAQANVWGISIARPSLGKLWVMAKHDGEVVMKHRGWIGTMPPIMRGVLL